MSEYFLCGYSAEKKTHVCRERKKKMWDNKMKREDFNWVDLLKQFYVTFQNCLQFTGVHNICNTHVQTYANS